VWRGNAWTMYLPKLFLEGDLARLHALIEAYDFAALIAPRGGGPPEIAHVPLMLDRARGERGTLIAHVARANPIWRGFDGEAEVVVVFQGPHAYVSPRFYVDRSRQVPTWNYAVVHAHGAPRLIEADEDVAAVLRRLVDIHEAGAPGRYGVDELTPAFFGELRRHIVAFEIEITRLEGKFKLSQNREPEDREGVIRGLRERGQGFDLAVVELMR
jgi:transcriptional regulator